MLALKSNYEVLDFNKLENGSFFIFEDISSDVITKRNPDMEYISVFRKLNDTTCVIIYSLTESSIGEVINVRTGKVIPVLIENISMTIKFR